MRRHWLEQTPSYTANRGWARRAIPLLHCGFAWARKTQRSGTIAYQPALDGVRALAVAAVLLFHAEVPGFSGGYLGVSVFFTLSGYLITTLLLTEHAKTGTISMSGFYARRVRRLLPASLVCLTAIVVISELTDVFVGVAELRRQVMGALLQVSNWVFLAGEGSYQQLFQQAGGARSPVEHFWSLSIEEQFYWLWPPTMAFLLAAVRTRRSRTLALGSLRCASSSPRRSSPPCSVRTPPTGRRRRASARS